MNSTTILISPAGFPSVHWLRPVCDVAGGVIVPSARSPIALPTSREVPTKPVSAGFRGEDEDDDDDDDQFTNVDDDDEDDDDPFDDEDLDEDDEDDDYLDDDDDDQ